MQVFTNYTLAECTGWVDQRLEPTWKSTANVLFGRIELDLKFWCKYQNFVKWDDELEIRCRGASDSRKWFRMKPKILKSWYTIWMWINHFRLIHLQKHQVKKRGNFLSILEGSLFTIACWVWKRRNWRKSNVIYVLFLNSFLLLLNDIVDFLLLWTGSRVGVW